jgi:hypothetical protein
MDPQDNVAVGGSWGYWYSLPVHPIGMAGTSYTNPSDNKFIWPRYIPMGGAAPSPSPARALRLPRG